MGFLILSANTLYRLSASISCFLWFGKGLRKRIWDIKSVLNTEVSLFQGCPFRVVPPYIHTYIVTAVHHLVEPKPFLEASVILRRNDQHSGVTHFK